jgi:FAD/FMN-containing dehydrogenase
MHAPGSSAGVSSDPGTLAVYSTDNSIYQVTPAGVVVPNGVDDVVDLVTSNRSASVSRPLVARGGGTGTNGQSLTDGLTIDFKRSMNRMQRLDVAARTAHGARAGR